MMFGQSDILGPIKNGGRTLRILDGLLTPRNEQCYETDCTTARLVVGGKIAHQEAIQFPFSLTYTKPVLIR
jgi:hypothetical protein